MPRTHVEGAPAPSIAPTENLLTTPFARSASAPAGVALRHPQGDGWRDVTWGELADRVRRTAAGLVALGVQPGDRVALMSGTRVEWTVADLAILATGAVTVPIYETSSVAQCEWILSDSGAELAIAGSADHAKNLDAARPAARDLGEIFVMDDGGMDALAERGTDADREQVERRVAAVGLDDVASIIYTSGTTGNPKGCVLTHGNLLGTARGSTTNLAELFQGDASTLLFLPLAHSFARIIQFGVLEAGAVLGYARSVETLVADLQSFSPTFLLAVPRIFEKVFNTAQRNATGAKRRVFDFAVATAREWSQAKRPGPASKAKRVVADRLVYAKLRNALGGRVRYCISGGAPLAPHLAEFFHAAGITILEGYGLTETSAGTTCNTPRAMRIGTVGPPTPGVEIRIDDDGEILIQGPGVFRGYWNNDAATQEAIDSQGWFHSGDLGSIDERGFLSITGRKKELIVTAGGKNVSPAVLEERLKAHHLVSQVMVVGDDRPFIAALITLEADELSAFAKEHGLSGGPAEMGKADILRAELAKAVAHANEAVSKAESIRKFTVLERDFTLEEGEMTPSLKLRRRIIAEHFDGDIQRLYTS